MYYKCMIDTVKNLKSMDELTNLNPYLTFNINKIIFDY